MDTPLWMLQVLWGVFLGLTSAKSCLTSPPLWNQALQEALVSAAPQEPFIFIGVASSGSVSFLEASA